MRILAFAYSCEPGQGSEGGVGWMWSRMLARMGEVCVLTNNRDPAELERERRTITEGDRIRFEFVRVPGEATWQKGERALRLHYLLWQLAALRRARALHRERPYHVAWHLTFANAWLGSTASLVGAPFIYGPVGGGAGTIWRFLPGLGLRGAAYEVLRAWARFLGRYVNPLARTAWRRAELILAQNRDTIRWLPRRHRVKCRVFPNAVVDGVEGGSGQRKPGPKTALVAGRLLPFKGIGSAIRAIGLTPDWRLLICGAGWDERRLRKFARQETRDGQVQFLGRLPRDEVLRIMREEADVLLFPSFHDQAPLTVAEALVSGLAVICLDRAGPAEIAGDAGLVVSTDEPDLPEALAGALQNPTLGAMRSAAIPRGLEFMLDSRAHRLVQVVRGTGLLPAHPVSAEAAP